jgi:alkylation response protein AidB-like acyl-CoA dehydrogenase
MDSYTPPIDDIIAALRTVGLEQLLDLPAFADNGIDMPSVREVLSGFADLAADVITPSDRVGDTVGARLDVATGVVTTAPELVHAFEQYVKGGWTALSAPSDAGGGGFPTVVATAVREMFGSANMALSLNPLLTQSAIEMLEQWADDRQRRLYLARLIDGTWTGTMNLTEPDAGSDLGAVRATATPLDNGQWAINGTKIFITWGEHELTDNIIHLVLARLPDAPEGTKGISVFLVPKILVDDDGNLQGRNGVRALSIEHKMGIHASPTCVLQFEDAVGELVGRPNGGMAAMFGMMNPARVAIGLQGVSIGERSLQQALSHAAERRQGSAGGKVPAAIIEHPDVRRMLVDMAVSTHAMRLLVYATSIASDRAHHLPDGDQRQAAQQRADLLTPLAKALPTDEGVRLASLAIQVHGGMGFIEETGVAQRYRDARIAPIYEGTNGIQAIDLVGRKIARDGGATAFALLDEMDDTVTRAAACGVLDAEARGLGEAIAATRQMTTWIVENFAGARDDVLAGASAYLRMFASTVAGELLVRETLAAHEVDPTSSETTQLVAQTRFYVADRLAPVVLLDAVCIGDGTLRAALG